MKLDWGQVAHMIWTLGVVKLFVEGLLFAIFLIVVRGLLERYFRKHPIKPAKSSTLIVTAAIILVLLVIVWKFL